MSACFQNFFALASGHIPDAGCAVPASTDKLVRHCLTQRGDWAFVALELADRIALSVDIHNLHVFAAREKTVVFNLRAKREYEALVERELPLEVILAEILLIHSVNLDRFVNGAGDKRVRRLEDGQTSYCALVKRQALLEDELAISDDCLLRIWLRLGIE